MNNEKDIVFIVDIKLNGKGRWSPSRSKPYIYSIESWKRWCSVNNSELYVLSEEIMPHSEIPTSWQRYFIFDLLEANNKNYRNILYVDADTIVHPDCPNLFELSKGKFSFVHNDASYDWVLRSMENYSKYFFDGYMFPWYEYFNSGMLIFNKKHKAFFKSIIEFYFQNKNKLDFYEKTWHLGTDQTPVNFLTHLLKVEYNIFPYEYNMVDLARKELLQEHLPYTELGWIYHFNSIPNNEDNRMTNFWMEKTFNFLYN